MPIDPVSANSPRPRFHGGCNEGCRPPSGFWIADMLLELQFFFFSIYFCNFPLKYYYFKKFYHTTTAFTGNFPCSLPLLWCSAQLWSQTEHIVSFFFMWTECLGWMVCLIFAAIQNCFQKWEVRAFRNIQFWHIATSSNASWNNTRPVISNITRRTARAFARLVLKI